MNILFLEDQGGVFEYLIEDLEDEGHTVLVAENIPKAKTFWHDEQIECIVADSNMPPEGLSIPQREETRGGLLSGWVWLKYYVFAENPRMKSRTIIVTAYLDELRKSVPEADLTGIRIVAKKRRGEPDTERLLALIRAIQEATIDGSEEHSPE